METIPVCDEHDFFMTFSTIAESHATPMGWRNNVADALIQNFPQTKEERKGFLSALFTLRNMARPGAYLRATDTWKFQGQINQAVNGCCKIWDEKYRKA